MNHIDADRIPDGAAVGQDFDILARVLGSDTGGWNRITSVSTNVAGANVTRDEFNVHQVEIASLGVPSGSGVEFQIRYLARQVDSAAIRPASLGRRLTLEDGLIQFTIERAQDFMLEINEDKWQALHVLVNEASGAEPIGDNQGLWYFGTGVNNGEAFAQVTDGQLVVPSDTIVYLAGGAFLTAQVVFSGVANASVQGPGFIYRPGTAYTPSASQRPRELDGGAILIERSEKISVTGVTSLRSFGFSLPVVEGHRIHIERFRSFSGYGNGDGIDLFCCKDVLIENCFLRNSDDTIAIYGHRWGYYGDTTNIKIRRCTLLPDIAHPIQIGTHGSSEKPERFSKIHVSDIDILDHEENQMWYQGCLSLNAGDENTIEGVIVENVRVEKITKGQLFNIRVMQNAMWTTAPGRGIRNIVLRNIHLDTSRSEKIFPSQIIGYDATRRIENVTIENLKIDGQHIHDGMAKPKWYMVADYVPMFVNEHVDNLVFK